MLESLTTERLRKKFKNNFDLCNFAINTAKNGILSGKSAGLRDVLTEVEHRADQDKLANALKNA